ncbi:MAG TPA: homoserine dehydrogenase [bacterium]
MNEIKVGLIGLGTVGTGVARILLEQSEKIYNRLGARIALKKVADIDVKRKRDVRLPKGVLIQDAQELLNDPEIGIVVELIGGTTTAKKYILRALKNGKHVVTANKALLSTCGEEIFNEAIKRSIEIGFEASVGGGIPLLKSIKEGLAANRFSDIYAIINGTSNYILTRMGEEKRSFSDVLSEAQAKGYAEADPTLDVGGIDSAHKLSILLLLSFGVILKPSDIPTDGIKTILPLDMEFAKDFGYKIKPLAIARQRKDGRVEAKVHPTMIPAGTMLASVDGVYNAVHLIGDAVGSMIFIGRGAGMMPTASAVVSDLVDIAKRIMYGGAGRTTPYSFIKKAVKKADLVSINEQECRYYLRFFVVDRPGVLARIASCLGRFGVSIESVIQKWRNTRGGVPIVIVTHKALERSLMKALKAIDSLDVVLSKSAFIRIEDGVV